ncbi:MAG: hypothetical protein IKW11_05820 [Bacteroidales bacterium]|nr:hypothetical protein [Bacteroidales bacterium]
MSNVLKVQIAGQRYRYEVMQVVFDEDNDWLKDQKELTQGEQRDFLRFNDNRLDISDYEYFDHQDAGVAIRHNGGIYYELGNSNGKMPMENVLSALNHPILLAHRNASKEDGLRLTMATVYDKENTIYEYSLEVGGNDFDASLLEIIVIRDPIMEEEDYIVELRYDGRKMNGGAERLSFGDPMDKNYMLQMPKEYAYALNLPVPESRNILKFDDFIKEENQKDRKKPNKVKSVKEYNEAIKDGYVKVREDYIHSFIEEHERGVEPEEEE